MASQAAAAYAAKQTMNNAVPQAASPNEGGGGHANNEQKEAKPAGVREWILRVGAVGNCKCLYWRNNMFVMMVGQSSR